MNTKTAKKRADHGVNGSRKEALREAYRPRVEAPPSTLALLRATWAKRDVLRADEKSVVHSFLQRAATRALTPKELAFAVDIGRRVGIGYDDPALDDQKASTSKMQPWGPLPLRPPTRQASAG